ncbi:MAG: M20/M25/M40 family metallo-hydrolase [Candidatus Cardinium sp.]|nr:M20/M25/M40 family metallo-hydrolase [Candidatus Cardinium sp.]
MTAQHISNASTDAEDLIKSIDSSDLLIRLKKHITYLADTIGIRNIENQANYQKLGQAADYICNTLKEMGLTPKSHCYTATYHNEAFTMKNIEVVMEGLDTAKEIILIGAHYDTVKNSPGADDNGSGVAALLEIVRYMIKYRGKNVSTLKLVFFPNEECDYSRDQISGKSFGPNMGSMVYAAAAKQHNENIKMIALESIGYFSNEPGSQRFPFCPFLFTKVLGFSDVANDIHFVSNWHSRSFLKACSKAFNHAQKPFPMQTFCAPDWLVPDIGRSDHKSFWLQDYTAIMITDTANLRNPHYHKATDVSSNVHYGELTKLVKKLFEMTKILVGMLD